jgi:DME family drug/metabolite transporter
VPRLLVLLAAVCFGTTGTAQALAPGGAAPVSVGAVRIVVGGALLALLAGAVARRVPVPPRIVGAGPALPLVLVGAVGVAAYQPTFFTGVRETGVAVGTLVALGSAPVLTGLLEWGVLRRRPSRRWALATALASAGVAVLALGTGRGARVDVVGVLAAVGAGASYAVYTLASKRLLERGWPPERVIGALFGGAAVLMAPLLLLADGAWLASGRGLGVALFLGVVPTALAYVLFARGLRRLPAAETATLTLAEPVTAGLLGLLLLREPASAAFWLGGLVLVAGLVVLAAPRRRGAEVLPQT